MIDGHLVLARVNILLIKRRSEYLSFRLTGKPSIATTKNTSLQKGTPLPLDKLSREPTQWRDARCPKHCRPSPSPPPPPRPPNRSLARCRVGRKLNCTIYLHRKSSSLSLCVAVCVSMTIVMTVCCTFLSCILERSPWSWEHCLILEDKQAS